MWKKPKKKASNPCFESIQLQEGLWVYINKMTGGLEIEYGTKEEHGIQTSNYETRQLVKFLKRTKKYWNRKDD